MTPPINGWIASEVHSWIKRPKNLYDGLIRPVALKYATDRTSLLLISRLLICVMDREMPK
jgi:hypothetical protein